MPRTPIVTRTPLFPALWIWLGVWASCSGWLLSAAHRLDAAGYVVALLLGVGAVGIAWKRGAFKSFQPPSLLRFKHRMVRPLPLAFCILATLVFLGGALYLPSNYDGIAYRTPRVLHWLAEGRWHWIHTAFPRLNTRSTGYEWLTVPLLVFTKSDRGFFLINFASLLLMPGLIFSTMTRLGVRAHVAWCWAWPLASGYCFALEGGGIQNDLLGAPYALAMIDFALRARVSKRSGEVWLSVLAAALLTGSKASNLVLLLPWALAILPCWRIPLRHPVAALTVTMIAVLSSFLPSAMINQHFTRDWTGMAIEPQPYVKNPVKNLAVNLAGIGIQNFLPPVFPFTKQWNSVAERFRPADISDTINPFKTEELAMEESAGLGFGVCVLLAISLVALATGGASRIAGVAGTGPRVSWILVLAPWISALVLAEKAFVGGSSARYFVPFYILLVAPFLISTAHEGLVRRRWWRMCAIAVIALAAVLVVVAPARPLWPARAFFSALEKRSSSPVVARAHSVYDTYGERPVAFDRLRQFLPDAEKTIGLVTWDDPETSLWHPFGTRRIRHVLSGDTREDLRKSGITFIVVSLDKFPAVFGPEMPFDRWQENIHAATVRKVSLRLRAGSQNAGLREWAIVRLAPETNTEH